MDLTASLEAARLRMEAIGLLRFADYWLTPQDKAEQWRKAAKQMLADAKELEAR